MKRVAFLNLKICILALIICLSLCLIGCNKGKEEEPVDNPPSDNPPTSQPANVTVSSYKILKGTPYVTDVYKYVTDKEGPKIAIVGGIHGDETAGWTAGLRLVELIEKEEGICGEILLIPQANIIADRAEQRYNVSGYDFSDLNRSFPLERYSDAKEETIKISTALVNELEAFDPEYIVDLHESLHSWQTMESGTRTSLGSTLIASNQNRFMRQLIKRYNEVYRPEDEIEFRQEGANQLGSFNYYFTNTYSEKVVFTVETNREYKNGVNTIDIEVRVRQQINVLKAMFDFAWSRI